MYSLYVVKILRVRSYFRFLINRDKSVSNSLEDIHIFGDYLGNLNLFWIQTVRFKRMHQNRNFVPTYSKWIFFILNLRMGFHNSIYYFYRKKFAWLMENTATYANDVFGVCWRILGVCLAYNYLC